MVENNVENKIVAKVDGKEISQQDVFQFLNEIDPQIASQFNTPEGIEKVIEELVNQELMYLDAKDKKMEEEKDYVKLLADSEVALLKSYALNKLIADVTVTEEDLKKYYEDHKEHFVKPETIVASHILVAEEEEANKAHKEIEDGVSFEDVATKYSTCPSKEQGGNLGEFGRGQMVPEFENHAFSMEKGEISKPVKSQFGYHIIRLEEENEEATRSFEEAKGEIQQQLIRLKQQEKYLEKIAKLEDKYTVEKFD